MLSRAAKNKSCCTSTVPDTGQDEEGQSVECSDDCADHIGGDALALGNRDHMTVGDKGLPHDIVQNSID